MNTDESPLSFFLSSGNNSRPVAMTERIQVEWEKSSKKFKTTIASSSKSAFHYWKKECEDQKNLENKKKEQPEQPEQLRIKKLEFFLIPSLIHGIELLYTYHPDCPDSRDRLIVCRGCMSNLSGETKVTGAIFWNPQSRTSGKYSSPTLLILGYCIGKDAFLKKPMYLFASPSVPHLTLEEQSILIEKTVLHCIRGPFCRFCENQIAEQLQPKKVKWLTTPTHLSLSRYWFTTTEKNSPESSL